MRARSLGQASHDSGEQKRETAGQAASDNADKTMAEVVSAPIASRPAVLSHGSWTLHERTSSRSTGAPMATQNTMIEARSQGSFAALEAAAVAEQLGVDPARGLS